MDASTRGKRGIEESGPGLKITSHVSFENDSAAFVSSRVCHAILTLMRPSSCVPLTSCDATRMPHHNDTILENFGQSD